MNLHSYICFKYTFPSIFVLKKHFSLFSFSHNNLFRQTTVFRKVIFSSECLTSTGAVEAMLCYCSSALSRTSVFWKFVPCCITHLLKQRVCIRLLNASLILSDSLFLTLYIVYRSTECIILVNSAVSKLSATTDHLNNRYSELLNENISFSITYSVVSFSILASNWQLIWPRQS